MKYFSIVFSLFLLFACERDPNKLCEKGKHEGSLRIYLDATVGNEAFQMNQEYRTSDSIRFRVSDLKFYIQLKLITKKGDTLQCTDNARLFNLNEPLRKEYRDFNFPVGDYSKIILGIGLDSSLNHQDPSSYDNEDDLSVFRGTYWSWASAYKFVAIEGKKAESKKDTSILKSAFRYHIGLDTCYRSKPFEKTFELNKKDMVEYHLSIDLLQLFEGDQSIDILTEDDTQASNDTEIALAIKMINNFIHAVELD